MRKISATLAIAVLLVIGWMASDDDTTPTTDPTGEPAAATTPTSAPDQPDEDSNDDAAPTAEPAAPEPTGQDREGVEADTPTPGSELSGSADSDNGGQSSPSSLSEQIAALPVADDDRTGYDRDDFGDYDRDALLAASLHDHGCYLSLADDQCYGDASEVHVDHIVALAEAWRSGLAKSDTDTIAEDSDNLWPMTASVNISKSDDDPAAWLPPDDAAVCTYITAYVEIKIEYSLTVDSAEQDALFDAAANCSPRS